MKRDDIFPSKYLKGSDLNGQPKVVTIERVERQKLKGLDGNEQEKAVIFFRGAKKALPLNRTNYDAVSGIVGNDDTDEWIGHLIELYSQKEPVAGTLKDCVRIRAPSQATPRKPTATKSPPAEGLDDDIPF